MEMCVTDLIRVNLCAGRQVSSNVPGGGQRITLIIAWWGLPLGAKPGAPGTGPCRALPSSSEALFAQHFQTWLTDFELGRPAMHTSQWRSAVPLSPAWVTVASGASEMPGGECAQHHSEISRQREDVNNGLFPVARVPLSRADRTATSTLPLPGLRFFLRSADEIRRVYVPQM